MNFKRSWLRFVPILPQFPLPSTTTMNFTNNNNSGASTNKATRIILLIATFLCPPLPIFLLEGFVKELLLSILLTIFGFHFLGIAYTLYYLWPKLSNNNNRVSLSDLEQGNHDNAVVADSADAIDSSTSTPNNANFGAKDGIQTNKQGAKTDDVTDSVTLTTDATAAGPSSSSLAPPPRYQDVVQDSTPLVTGDYKVQN